MTLKEWMESTGSSAASVARDLGLSRQMIYNYMKRDSTPTIPVAHRIEQFTGGQVTLYDWVDSQPALTDLL